MTRCHHTELLARLCDEPDAIGTTPGETCNRVHEPDEDAPRGYRPRPCAGEMIDSDGVSVCDTCGENNDH
ncbi:hypothetical protein [Pararhodobacter sp. CCB-MM2]|uniref:hypothetical protein n=1 Tax=Pararhodobacter sp. CCB-MM2 TaxID=1786003 RepID=UPI0008309383|nr:hypothetical protein [Pararhodobacter sp. CCB-MM2]